MFFIRRRWPPGETYVLLQPTILPLILSTTFMNKLLYVQEKTEL
ncbi:hypothetical protein CDL12_19515 [Handroanthus impetiginosus]|uniref:Uncharacterized protein n=1 Tax=Handroanthus impetiginosus TaxID=429701 RepID=A0A2G9GRK2_9LAMI|nr:hypothetical protein CDL12_19515 [Handroanthus impetiginosus]